jgi:hypothetical protein
MERLENKKNQTELKFENRKMYNHMKYLFGDSFEYMCDKYKLEIKQM